MPQPGFCHALSSLHSKVVITTQDKNPQGFSVLCRHFYLQTLKKELMTPTYEPVCSSPESREAIYESHRAMCRKANVRCPPLVGYFWGAPKLHKLEPHRAKWRWLNGHSTKNFLVRTDKPPSVPTTSLTPLGKRLSMVLHSIIDVHLLDDALRNDGIKYCWIIRTIEEMTNGYDCFSGDILARDFTTLYTMLPHSTMIQGVCEEIDAAVEILQRHMHTSDQLCFVFNDESQATGQWRVHTDQSTGDDTWSAYSESSLTPDHHRDAG
jgi:hypothetical protein